MPGSFFRHQRLAVCRIRRSRQGGPGRRADRRRRHDQRAGTERDHQRRPSQDGHVMDGNPRLSVHDARPAAGAASHRRHPRNRPRARRALRAVDLGRDDRRLGAARRLRHALVRRHAGRDPARRPSPHRQPVSRSVRRDAAARFLNTAHR